MYKKEKWKFSPPPSPTNYHFQQMAAQLPQPGHSRAEQQSIPLPEKLGNARHFKNAEPTKVVLNAYALDTTKAIKEVYKHELKFTGFYPPEKTKDLSCGPKNDVANQTRHHLLWAMFQQMLEAYPDIFGSSKDHKSFVYDCGINLYSIKKILSQGETAEFDIELDRLPEECRIYLGRRISNLKAHILACETVDLKSLESLAESRNRGAVQFMEILSSQEAIRRDTYYIFASKMFDKASEIRLQTDPRVLKEGMQKNVRFVGDNLRSATPILQVDPKKSAFFPNMTVDAFLAAFLPGRPGDHLERKLNPNTLRAAAKQIKGLTVMTTHMAHGKNRSFVIYGLTADPAERQTFDCKGQRVSVTEYYQQNYQLRLRSPRLPCVIERRPGKTNGKHNESYYPMEVCQIVAGQRVSLDQQTPQLTEQMIRNCQALPRDFIANNKKQQEQAFLTNGNPYFRSHGVRVETELITADAEVLYPPAVVYERNQTEEPDQRGVLPWGKMGGKKFIVPAETPQVWAAIIFQGGVNGNDCNNFIGQLLNSAKQKGMNVQPPTRSDQFESTDYNYIKQKLSYYKQNNCQFVMFFTKDKLDDVHHTMKLMEVEFGICTQHISSQTMTKAIGNKGAWMVIDNLLLKLNLKLGGINHSLSTASAFASANRVQHDVMTKEWLRDTRMFIGLDMSHAAPQSLYERQAGHPCKEPTIVGMSYTMGHPLRMRGTFWCQESRVAHIHQLSCNVKEALLNYSQQNNRFPQHLVVFRGGVSEGEYRIVLDEEQSAFQAAFQELQTETGFRTPDLTIVVVQRNSNYRIIPKIFENNGKAFEQNVRAGTCLDQKVMHPTQTEFLLVGHKTIQGTAHPIRCTVIADTCSPRVSLEEIENVTYALCYSHGIVLSPVSVPSPLYSASDLAKRGRNNWKCKKNEDDERGTQSSSSSDEKLSEHYLMLPLRSIGFWRIKLNCLKNRACCSTDSIRFKSAWIREVQKKAESVKTNETGEQSSGITESADVLDVERLFIDLRVQRILRSLIGMDIEKIYSERVVSATERKHYALMTDDMIAHIRSKMEKRGRRFQTFVPVKEPRSTTPTVLANDEELKGFDNAKFVFTDISFDATFRDRIVLVREPNGILRTSTPEEHDRMNRVYYPSEDKPVLEPGVFSDPSFTEALQGNRHEIVMDWACHFFEPDDPRYVEICAKVFDEIAKNDKCDVLRSTRHFATMVFYLVLNQKFAPLLNYFSSTKSIADVVNTIRLIKIMHPHMLIPSIKGEKYEKILDAFVDAQNEVHLKKLENLISFRKELKEKAEKEDVGSAS